MVSKSSRTLIIKEFLRISRKIEEELKISPIKILKELDIKIPISLYRSGLSTLELVSIYLIDFKGLSIKNAVDILFRSKQSIFQSYKVGKSKIHGEPILEKSTFDIPIKIFSEKRFSPLESVVKYLREEKNLGVSDIGKLLVRDPRTIWTVYNRSKTK